MPQSASEAFPIAKGAQAVGQREPREFLRAARRGRVGEVRSATSLPRHGPDPEAAGRSASPHKGVWAMRPCGLVAAKLVPRVGNARRCLAAPVAPGGDGEAGRAWGGKASGLLAGNLATTKSAL